MLMRGYVNQSDIALIAEKHGDYSRPGVHDWAHIMRVVDYAKQIAEQVCPDMLDEVILAAYFHDVGRKDEGSGNQHAIDGAEVARNIISAEWPEVDLESIVFAIRHHSDTEGVNGSLPLIQNFAIPEGVNPKVAVCLWDADRLELMRTNPERDLDVRYYHSDFARKLVNTPEHRAVYK